MRLDLAPARAPLDARRVRRSASRGDGFDALRSAGRGGDRHRRDRASRASTRRCSATWRSAATRARGRRRRRPARRSGAGQRAVRAADALRRRATGLAARAGGDLRAGARGDAFDTYEEALQIANGVSLGLTASVYTRDLATAHRFARDVEAGFVWVNDTAEALPGRPFGGVKDSGVGREEGIDELVSYAQVKNVNVRSAEPARASSAASVSPRWARPCEERDGGSGDAGRHQGFPAKSL